MCAYSDVQNMDNPNIKTVEKYMQWKRKKWHFLKRQMSCDIFIAIIFIVSFFPLFNPTHKTPQQLP